MSEAFQIMTWPFLACLLLPGLLVYMGLHIVQREIIFVDLALAQVAALGICMAILLGHDAYDWQTAAAASFLLLSRSPEGNEQLRKTLVGEVLLVRPGEVLRTFILFLAVGTIHVIFRRQFWLLSFAPQQGRAEGQRLWFWDFLFYVLFGIVVTSFVRMGGVLLVFSYLIIPAVCANLFAASLRTHLVVGWIVATLASVVGLYTSYWLDLPTGAAVVCSLGLALLLAGLVRAATFIFKR